MDIDLLDRVDIGIDEKPGIERHRKRRRQKVIKDDRLFDIYRETKHCGKNYYVSDNTYSGKSLHHSKAYIKWSSPKDSKPKKQASRASRRISADDTADGNNYKKHFDYKWKLY